MVKAKDIRNIKDSIIKYKTALDKEHDLIQKLKFEREIREQQYRLMDVQIQLLNIEIDLHKDAQLYIQVFIDKYINGLTVNHLAIKYNMARSSIYRLVNTAKALFEKE